jgi:Ser/Thr protein kinase RdoA (MazF antagonist)
MNRQYTTEDHFKELTPDLILHAAEEYTGLRFDSMLTPYNSYVNRVFGLTAEDGKEFIIKFYRPGRWNIPAIGDEHTFVADCAANGVSVAPLLNARMPVTQTTPSLACSENGLWYTMMPRIRARTFDIISDTDWISAGQMIGALHRTAQNGTAPARVCCTPAQTTEPYIARLLGSGLVVPQLSEEFIDVCDHALDYIEAAYESCFPAADHFIRIHGDCHRGNILVQTDRQKQSILTLIDFDDMMTGPAIQDLWLLLPGYRKNSLQELNLLLEGYESCMPLQPVYSQIRLIEPLRFMRHIYFLAWTAIQYNDTGFAQRAPGWGSRVFWEKEIEDLKTQLTILESEYSYFEKCQSGPLP